MLYSASSPSLGYMGYTEITGFLYPPSARTTALVAVVDCGATILAEMVSVGACLPWVPENRRLFYRYQKPPMCTKRLQSKVTFGWLKACKSPRRLPVAHSREVQRLPLLHFSLLLFIVTPPGHPVFFSFKVRSIVLQACL